MHTQIIDKSVPSNTALIDQIFQLRNVVFKERLGWQVECLHGREIDEFDTKDAVYGTVINKHESLVGCFRLLPTTKPYMLKNIFSEVLHGATAPEDERVFECSRFAVLPSVTGPATLHEIYKITAELLGLQITFCLERGIHTVVSVTDTRFERILQRSGLFCERYGPPIQIGVTRAVAGFMHPTKGSLAAVNIALSRIHKHMEFAGAPIAIQSEEQLRTAVSAP